MSRALLSVRPGLLILSVALISIAIWLPDDPIREKTSTNKQHNSMLQYSNDMVLRNFNAQGKLNNELAAQRFIQYEDERTELIEPVLRFNEDEQEKSWQLQSQQGLLAGEQLLYLDGKVEILHRGNENWRMHTEALSVDLSQKIAVTDKKVSILFDHGTIEANNLMINVNEKRSILRDHVEAVYYP